MGHLKLEREIFESFCIRLKEKCLNFSLEDVSTIADLVKDEILYRYVDRLNSQVEAILEISPSLNEREILNTLARIVAEYLEAEAVTIRIYDPEKKAMIPFGFYPESANVLEEGIPFEETILGEVVKTQRKFIIANPLKEEKYRNQEKVEKLGIHSMLAIPFLLPRYSLIDSGTEGSLQIYYKEEERNFSSLEIKIAEVLSKRVSYVIARKRIMDLEKMNVTKDKILEYAFLKLARREGIKMKDMFNSIIPELVDIIKIQRCSLFSVMEDREHVVLEAGYPEAEHGIGKINSVKEPYINLIVNQEGPFGEFENEKIYPTYILIHNPKESFLLPSDLKRFLESQQINSVLYIPLTGDEIVKYFLVFDAQARHRRFTDDEIKIFIFFGKELMKGLRIEKLDDILHDLRAPAMASAGVVKRGQKILKDGGYPSKKEKVDQALDIILEETSHIQELALTLYGEGKEEIVDLTEKLKRRFLLNEEAMKELRRENIHFVNGDLESSLRIRCFLFHIERVLDNLLNNASNAIPEEGGELSVRSYRQDPWAVVEIINTGQISEEEKNRLLSADTSGRGLHTVTRLVNHMGGKMEVESQEGKSTFRVLLPLVNP